MIIILLQYSRRVFSYYLLYCNRKFSNPNIIVCVAVSELAGHGCEPDVFTQSLLTNLDKLEPCEPTACRTVLLSALEKHRYGLLRLDGQVQQTTAVILEPSANHDTNQKFVAGLTLAVDLIATIHNISQLTQLAVRVRQLAVRVRQLAVRVRQLAVRVRQLAVRVRQLAVRVRQLAVRVRQLAVRVRQLAVG